jgi:hypothetical protein
MPRKFGFVNIVICCVFDQSLDLTLMRFSFFKLVRVQDINLKFKVIKRRFEKRSNPDRSNLLIFVDRSKFKISEIDPIKSFPRILEEFIWSVQFSPFQF